MKHALCCRGFFSFGGRPRVWTFGWRCWRWSGLGESLRKSLFVRQSVVSSPRWSSLQPACARPSPLPPLTAAAAGPPVRADFIQTVALSHFRLALHVGDVSVPLCLQALPPLLVNLCLGLLALLLRLGQSLLAQLAGQ